MADRSPLSRRPKGAKGPASASFRLSISCCWKLSPLGDHVITRKEEPFTQVAIRACMWKRREESKEITTYFDSCPVILLIEIAMLCSPVRIYVPEKIAC